MGDRVFVNGRPQREVIGAVGTQNSGQAVHGGPHKQGIQINGRGGGRYAVNFGQNPAKNIKCMVGIANEIGMISRLGPSGIEHEPVLKRVRQRKAQILLAQCVQLKVRVGVGFASVKVMRKLLIAAAHDLGQQMVAARVVPIRRLVRNAQTTGHVTQAQVFNAVLCNDFACSLNAGITQIHWCGDGGGA